MSADDLVEFEISRIDWSRLRCAGGDATDVPRSLRRLIYSRSVEDAVQAYWELERAIVVSDAVYEVAVFVIPVIFAALASMSPPRFVRIELIELLFQILNGYPESGKIGDLDVQCRNEAKKGLWLLYAEVVAQDGSSLGASEVIRLIEDDQLRAANCPRDPPLSINGD